MIFAPPFFEGGAKETRTSASPGTAVTFVADPGAAHDEPLNREPCEERVVNPLSVKLTVTVQVTPLGTSAVTTSGSRYLILVAAMLPNRIEVEGVNPEPLSITMFPRAAAFG